MTGNGADEQFFAAPGNDTVDGSDWIQGGPGDDMMTGGAGRDTFHFRRSEGRDTITNFSPGDVLEFYAVAPKEVSWRAVDGHVEVDYGGIGGQGGNHGTILLLGVPSVPWEAYSFV